LIFVTVGSMLPFDRLVEGMDRWAFQNPEHKVVAQIGKGRYEPKHMTAARIVPPSEFKRHVTDARLIVGHAGMGSVITALERRKKIVLLPRRAALKEHTTDHQIHTAQWLLHKPNIYVAMSETELPSLVSRALEDSANAEPLSDRAPAEFTSRIRGFLLGEKL
jgi:UDP-N-acetylglucosamine transferase subunit ALG13